VISGDGTRIAYVSYATDITGDPKTSGITQDVFLYDRTTQTTRRLSTPPADGDDVFGPGELSISHDGRQASFRLHELHNPSDHSMSLWADCASSQPTCGDGAIEPGCPVLGLRRFRRAAEGEVGRDLQEGQRDDPAGGIGLQRCCRQAAQCRQESIKLTCEPGP
jgi:hypothetical protein